MRHLLLKMYFDSLPFLVAREIIIGYLINQSFDLPPYPEKFCQSLIYRRARGLRHSMIYGRFSSSDTCLNQQFVCWSFIISISFACVLYVVVPKNDFLGEILIRKDYKILFSGHTFKIKKIPPADIIL